MNDQIPTDTQPKAPKQVFDYTGKKKKSDDDGEPWQKYNKRNKNHHPLNILLVLIEFEQLVSIFTTTHLLLCLMNAENIFV